MLKQGNHHIINRVLSVPAALILALALLASCGQGAKPLTAAELIDLGHRYLLEGNYDEAILTFEQLIGVEERNPLGYIGAAMAHMGLEDPDAAALVLEQGLDVIADEDGGALTAMLALVESGDYSLRAAERIWQDAYAVWTGETDATSDTEPETRPGTRTTSEPDTIPESDRSEPDQEAEPEMIPELEPETAPEQESEAAAEPEPSDEDGDEVLSENSEPSAGDNAADAWLLSHIAFDGDYHDSITGVTGTPQGSPQFVEGLFGRALWLNGDGDYVSFGSGYNLPDEFTISFWVKSEDISRKWPAVFCKYETNSYGPYDFQLHYNKISYWISKGNGSHIEVDGNSVLEENRWYMITFVKSGERIGMYLNGQPDGSGDCPANMINNDDEVTVGRQSLMFTPYDELQFKGCIDDIRIYSTALNESDITGLYNLRR
jgi:tetratricopeptide (TPR) repeat protein